LWGICYYTSCRISEALQLTRSDLIGSRIIFRAQTTKDKKTRDIKVSSKLAAILAEYPLPEKGYIFSNDQGKSHLSRQAADLQLRKSCDYLGFIGVSTHSFRRTSITALHRQGVPLKFIQKRSGHASLGNLARYVEVDQELVDAAGELL
jgi:integrase/recombinase XerD